MFVPVILGSDKTVVSVATGHTEYWPLYLSIGNVHNHVRHAHKGAVAVIGFLSILKSKCTLVKPLTYTDHCLSKEKVFGITWISQIQVQVIPILDGEDAATTSHCNDCTRACLVWQWTWLTCRIWSRTIYCWLWGTSPLSVHCTRVVWEVSTICMCDMFDP